MGATTNVDVNYLISELFYDPDHKHQLRMLTVLFTFFSLHTRGSFMDDAVAIIALSFCGAIGFLLVVLGCALEEYGIWWPMFVLFFYTLAPVPIVIAKRFSEDFSSNTSNVVKETAMFFTAGNVVSAFGLPIVLAHCEIIKWGACGLVLSGNVFIFFTILAYFLIFSGDDDWGF